MEEKHGSPLVESDFLILQQEKTGQEAEQV